MLKRQLIQPIIELCFKDHKMAFISGPRQVGKTTLSNQMTEEFDQFKYVNWDDPKNRKTWSQDPTLFLNDFNLRKKNLIIFDEIHKAKNWKTQLKGLWDQENKNCNMIVTGSAQLNTLKKAGDSLLGRYYHFHLHPLTIGEILQTTVSPEELMQTILTNSFEKNIKSEKIFHDLEIYSGFPEPYILKEKKKFNLWKKTRLERLVREDLRDLSKLPDLSSVEILMSLLPSKVGSGLSVENLRRDIETSHNSVKRWLKYLEAVYYHYHIKPYSKNITSSLKKEPKIYLYDYTEIDDPGSLYENMIANHLFKACHFWTDTGEGNFELHYIKTKQQVEIDFLITKDKKPWLAIETKKSEKDPATAVFNMLQKMNCPLVLLTKKPIQSKLIKNKSATYCRVSIDCFLHLLP